MIVKTMSHKEISRELANDFNWLREKRHGWIKKYRKRLQPKYLKDNTILERKVYISPSYNKIHCIFFCKKGYKQKWNELAWSALWEITASDGRKRYISYAGVQGECTVITAHAAERMHERSGKTFIEMFEDNLTSSTGAVFAWVKYEEGGETKEATKFGDGFLIGTDDENGNTIAVTYVSQSMQFPNQVEFINMSRALGENHMEESKQVFIAKRYRRKFCVKARA